MKQIPQTMKAVVQSSANSKLEIKEVEVPVPQKGEVLVKMEFASVNPSDLSTLQGTYAEKPNYPIIPGIEGSGTVVAKGSGLLPALRMGKRVSCTSSVSMGGSWAEYMLTSAMHVVPVSNQISFEQASALIVNPLTAIAFIDIAKKGKYKTIVNNAAGGALGKMLVRMTKKYDLNLISIVRSAAQKENLQAMGAQYVLDSSEQDYLSKLTNLTHKLNAQLFFDAVGGQATNDFISAGPRNTQVYVYAQLSEGKSYFDARKLLQQNKSIQSFYLGNYSSEQNIIKTLQNLKKAQKLIHQELQTLVSETYLLEQINEAIEVYSNNMSNGKVLIKCS